MTWIRVDGCDEFPNGVPHPPYTWGVAVCSVSGSGFGAAPNLKRRRASSPRPPQARLPWRPTWEAMRPILERRGIVVEVVDQRAAFGAVE